VEVAAVMEEVEVEVEAAAVVVEMVAVLISDQS
jgi:hypothetical protein